MRIFVAGATGALGRLLVPMLIADGHDVTGATRTLAGSQALTRQGASAVCVDVHDPDALTAVVASAAPEVVVHQVTALAAGDPVDNARIRREGTRNLVDARRPAAGGAVHRLGVRAR